MNHFFKIAALCALLALGACGDDDGDDTTVVVNPDNGQQQEQAEQGTFSGSTPIIINNRVDNNVRVSNRVRVEGDDVIADVACQGAPSNVIHQQIIHIGVRCPTIADDTNADGYVDWQETQAVVGPELLSLDQNLESQENTGFPSGANYTYSRRASLQNVRTTLPAGEDFNLEGKVLVVYGASPETQFPATVTSDGNNPVNVSIPIFCNVIQKTSNGNTTTTTTTGGTNGTTGSTTGTSTGTTGTVGTTTGGATTGSTTGGTTSSTDTSAATTTGTTTGGTMGTTTGTDTTTGTTTGTAGTTTGTTTGTTSTTGGGI